MIKRDMSAVLKELEKQFAAIAVLGPRQSGKTTLVQSFFSKHTYVNLEELDIRAQALDDPRKFLQNFTNDHGIIIDEVQHAPGLLSYIQTIIDREKKKGFFIITGSQNILVNEAVTQTLAGRIAILRLLPLSLHELKQSSLLPKNLDEIIFAGTYPRIYDEKIPPVTLHKNYISSYIEHDVRQIKNIFDLHIFQKFMQLCAGRTGQILNLESLGNDVGIDHKTARSWISVLEASYIVFLLYPYYKNFGKRIIKSPKLYFIDTGIACSLLNIKSVQELSLHYLYGGLVESFIISDLLKQFYNLDQKPSLYFWRDYQGNEIDCFIEAEESIIPIEIKAGQTINESFFKQFFYLETLEHLPIKDPMVIYGGDQNRSWQKAEVLSWQNAGEIVKKVVKK